MNIDLYRSVYVNTGIIIFFFFIIFFFSQLQNTSIQNTVQ
jgi:hypothetical protein